MLRTILTVMAIVLPVMYIGCAGEPQEPAASEPPGNVDEKNGLLTGDFAKRALLEMGSRQIPPGCLVPGPTNEPIQVISENEISIGIYHCDLKMKTFRAEAHYPGALRHKKNFVYGVFERNAAGKWVAKVEEA